MARLERNHLCQMESKDFDMPREMILHSLKDSDAVDLTCVA